MRRGGVSPGAGIEEEKNSGLNDFSGATIRFAMQRVNESIDDQKSR